LRPTSKGECVSHYVIRKWLDCRESKIDPGE
jgi:hypothetical protein